MGRAGAVRRDLLPPRFGPTRWAVFFSGLGTVFPRRAGPDLPQIEPGTLVVGGVEPEHAGEDGGGFVEALQAPSASATRLRRDVREAETVTVEFCRAVG